MVTQTIPAIDEIFGENVRRQGFWNQDRRNLIESLAHFVSLIMRRASGVQMGTRFLKSEESKITRLHRRILEGTDDRESTITNVFSSRPARGFVNRLIRDIGPINANVQTFPLAISALNPLRTATAGSEDFVSMWAGQNCKTGEPNPAAEIVKELAKAFDPA